jgi:hypothetical protein
MISHLSAHNNLGETPIEVLFLTLIQNCFERHWEPKSSSQPHHASIAREAALDSFKYWVQIRIALHVSHTTPPDELFSPIPPTVIAACKTSPLLPTPASLQTFVPRFVNLLNIDSPRVHEILDEQVLFEKMKTRYADQRCLLRTRGRRLGLGSMNGRVGDQVWFLNGARVPFLLRKMENGSFKVVGEVYIHGFMKGEVFTAGELSTEDAVEVILE